MASAPHSQVVSSNSINYTRKVGNKENQVQVKAFESYEILPKAVKNCNQYPKTTATKNSEQDDFQLTRSLYDIWHFGSSKISEDGNIFSNVAPKTPFQKIQM